jgi:hypothetical protein
MIHASVGSGARRRQQLRRLLVSAKRKARARDATPEMPPTVVLAPQSFRSQRCSPVCSGPFSSCSTINSRKGASECRQSAIYVESSNRLSSVAIFNANPSCSAGNQIFEV